MTDKMKMVVQRSCMWLVAVALALAVLYGAGWLVWDVMQGVDASLARAWALVATALLPVTVFVTWRLALRYAVGVVHGIDTGITKVAKAGAEAANLRVHVHHALRQKEQPTVVLPDVVITPRQLASGGQIINL